MKSGMTRVDRKRLPDQIAEQILSLIEKGKLRIGDKLPPEQVLTKEFGVGRSSLREAIGALAIIGVLNASPGRGTYVIASPISPLESPAKWDTIKRYGKARELVEARIILEQASAELAAKKATEQEIGELETRLSSLEHAKTNAQTFNQADLSFHLALAKASHNDILVRFLSELRHPIRTWMDGITRYISADDIDVVIRQHAEILEAIEKRDVEKARLAVLHHFKSDLV